MQRDRETIYIYLQKLFYEYLTPPSEMASDIDGKIWKAAQELADASAPEEMRNAVANLETILDLIEGYADVKDGDYGELAANNAMQAQKCAEQTLTALQQAIKTYGAEVEAVADKNPVVRIAE